MVSATALGTLFLPAAAVVIGCELTTRVRPGPEGRQLLQHLAAGLVFAAVSVELVPDLKQTGLLILSVGFAAGTLAMLGVRSVTAHLGGASAIVAVAVDVVIDGAVLGAAPDAAAALLLAAGLSVELLFLGVTLGLRLADRAMLRRAVVGSVAGLFILAGALTGGGTAAPSSGGHGLLLAFGTAAMLYLVVEDLLVEAHEVKDTPIAAGAFFAGFLAVLVGAARLTQ